MASALGVRPTKLGHVASYVPDLLVIQRFYIDVLGFRWSDTIGDFFTFLRCNVDHHAINLMQSDKRSGLFHVAYEVRDFLHLKDHLDHLATRGHTLEWGPGRHGVGHNIFSYHRDPDGNLVELFTEIDLIYDEETCALRAATVARESAAGTEGVGSRPRGRQQVGDHQPGDDGALMRAVVMRAFGDADVLECEDVVGARRRAWPRFSFASARSRSCVRGTLRREPAATHSRARSCCRTSSVGTSRAPSTATGADVDVALAGQRVAASCSRTCGICVPCRHGP